MPGFDDQLADGVEVHGVVQVVLQVQFLVNDQPARFDVDEFLGQQLIFLLAGAAAVLHSGVELAEVLALVVLLWVQALFADHSS